MKKQLTSSLMQMSAQQIKNLTTVVNETLAADLSEPKTRIFTAAELWSIQRRGISRTQRRIIF